MKTILPEIIHEDNHILAVNKPTGMLVQGDKTGDESILDAMKRFIKERDGKPGQVFLGLPHRLDRPVSGVLVLAKTSKALSRLAASFRDGGAEKIYWAAVEAPPDPPEGWLTDWLRKDEKTNTSHLVGAECRGAKEARLSYKLIGASKRYWLVELRLLTGRHHQIRAQMAGMGCPIKGDLKYGARRSNPGGGIHLHARRLVLPHPVREGSIFLTAPLPPDAVWQAFPQI
ncbi:MAG: RNA pseudouridine synthase [Spirochaeta sp. LUC14_002_19_P3]|nr:MAG: RNA pseudouridine synthase [Spirochaeta sp. LUC14_002_19_P3]